MASRYDNLNLAVEATVNNSKKNKPYRIVETGTHTADRAVALITLAKKLGRTNVEYYGFDFFEDMTEYAQTVEFCRSSFPVSRDIARTKLAEAGASKIQLAKGDSKDTLPQAADDIQLAAVISIDGGSSVNTIASDFAQCLRFSYEGTKIVINNCIPNNFSRGSAFILKSADVLKSDYGITVEAASPIDVVSNDPYHDGPVYVQCITASCAAQLTPFKLAGVESLLLAGAVRPPEPEPQELMPDLTFLDPAYIDAVPAPIPEANTVEPEEVSAPAAAPFPEPEVNAPCCAPAQNCSNNTDVQSVRVCENSCGKPAGEHCELPSDSCGRREPAVEPEHVGTLSEEVVPPVQVPEERQEPDQVVEQGSTASASEQVPDNSGGELRPEVSPNVEQGNRRGNRRRRRSGGANDECTGPQA